MAADGPAMLAAAVRAACLAKAPRRTIQAVAAAVAGVFAHPATARATPAPVARMPAGTQRAASEGDGGEASTEVLIAALREARSTKRRNKRARRKAARAGDSAVAQEAAAQEAPVPKADAAAATASTRPERVNDTATGTDAGGRPVPGGDAVGQATVTTPLRPVRRKIRFDANGVDALSEHSSDHDSDGAVTPSRRRRELLALAVSPVQEPAASDGGDGGR